MVNRVTNDFRLSWSESVLVNGWAQDNLDGGKQDNLDGGKQDNLDGGKQESIHNLRCMESYWSICCNERRVIAVVNITAYANDVSFISLDANSVSRQEIYYILVYGKICLCRILDSSQMSRTHG